jgi:hypothetical protein
MGIGSFFNTKGVIVGQAMGLYAPAYTPLPADTIKVFDEPTWVSTQVSLGGATGGTWTLSLAKGVIDNTVTTAALAFGITSTALATALTAALVAAGYTNVTPVVTGAGTAGSPFMIAFVGPGAAEIVVTGTGTLTGGSGATPLVTPPSWSAMGGTEQGWGTSYTPQTQDITIEEQQTPVGRYITGATYEFTANLSEDSMENLTLALSGARTITAAASGVYGSDQMTMTENLPVIAVALETQNRKGYPRRYYVPGATCAVNVGQTFRRAAAQHLIPVTFSSVCPTEDIAVRSITAPSM